MNYAQFTAGTYSRVTIVLLMSLSLVGCNVHAGPEILQTVEAGVPGAQAVKVHVATTREREAADRNVFTSSRAAAPNYASFTISVPPTHRPGRIEWPKDRPDPATGFAVLDQAVLSREDFFRGVGDTPGTSRDVLVFVHGYNQNFQQALYRLTQIVADARLDGANVLFAWPSQGEIVGYVADKDAVTYSRDALTDLLATLASDPKVGTITVLAHSMGSWLTVEALRQLRLTRKDDVLDRLAVVLAAPDIDVEVFRAQMELLGPLRLPVIVLVSSDDRTLLVSSRLRGTSERLGALDIDDARVKEAAQAANIALVDISGLRASDPLNHDRYVSFAVLYPSLAEEREGSQTTGLRSAGASIFNAIGATVSSPFTIVGRALAAE